MLTRDTDNARDTLAQWQMTEGESSMGSTRSLRLNAPPGGRDRRQYRRHDVEQRDITVDRWEGRPRSPAAVLGRVVDLSAGGMRVRTRQGNIHPDQQIRVRLELPAYSGISPFVDTTGPEPRPARTWTGWLSVARVDRVNDREYDVAGRLVDMEEMDRGMLGLYLSTQPMAA